MERPLSLYLYANGNTTCGQKRDHLWVACIESRRMDLLEWMLDVSNNLKKDSIGIERYIATAVLVQWPEALDKMFVHGIAIHRYIDEMWKSAAAIGDIRMLEWIKNKFTRLPEGESSCLRAVEGGHLPALRWLSSHGAVLNNDTCKTAVHYGHVDRSTL